jgi:mannose-6-phosphate isomerase-like protein (cupin superfamily)
MDIKINTSDIPTERIHQNTTFRKRLISSGQYNGNIATMNYAWLTPGTQLDPHTHPDGEEFYFFLGGTGEILVGKNWITIQKHDFVTIPTSHIHSVKNTGRRKLTFVTVRITQQKNNL